MGSKKFYLFLKERHISVIEFEIFPDELKEELLSEFEKESEGV